MKFNCKRSSSWLACAGPKCQYPNPRRAPQQSQHAAAGAHKVRCGSPCRFVTCHKVQEPGGCVHNQSFLEVTLRESRHAANQLPPKLLLATSADLTGSRQHVCTAQEQSTVYTLCWNSDLQVAPPPADLLQYHRHLCGERWGPLGCCH